MKVFDIIFSLGTTYIVLGKNAFLNGSSKPLVRNRTNVKMFRVFFVMSNDTKIAIEQGNKLVVFKQFMYFILTFRIG